MFFFLFLHYSSCSPCITASLPLPLFLSLMLLFLPFYCHELFLFPSSPYSSLRDIQAVPCVKELGLSNNRSFYWTFCRLSGWACMNNTCGDPLTSPSLLKESISIPPFPVLQALAPLSVHCNALGNEEPLPYSCGSGLGLWERVVYHISFGEMNVSVAGRKSFFAIK